MNLGRGWGREIERKVGEGKLRKGKGIQGKVGEEKLREKWGKEVWDRGLRKEFRKRLGKWIEVDDAEKIKGKDVNRNSKESL